jgi:hypothetical protein
VRKLAQDDQHGMVSQCFEVVLSHGGSPFSP